MSAASTPPVASQFAESDPMAHNGASKEAVIFLHLPKTAGTTVNRLIEWEYPLKEMYSVDPVLFQWSAAHLRALSPERLRKIRMFKGHMAFGLHEVLPQKATYITVLRDPVDRVISAFHFMRSYKLHPLYWKMRRENWTLEDFVNNTQRDNVQSKIVAGSEFNEPCTREIVETAKGNLRNHFSVVGLSARLEESLALMKLRFGWRLSSYSSFNVTRSRPKKRDLPPATLDLIHQRNAFDIELYACAEEIFESAVQANAVEVKRISGELEAARSRSQGSLGAILFNARSAARKAMNRVYSAV
ncbi:MAG: sulfotransferase family 2 domain-containing protein [Chthoniobacterales bacterium]